MNTERTLDVNPPRNFLMHTARLAEISKNYTMTGEKLTKALSRVHGLSPDYGHYYENQSYQLQLQLSYLLKTLTAWEEASYQTGAKMGKTVQLTVATEEHNTEGLML